MSSCPCCNRTFAPPLPSLSGNERFVYDLLCRRLDGMTNPEISDALYADDPEGGPDTAEKRVANYIYRINRKLRGTGSRIVGTRGPGAVFRLVTV